MKRLTTNAMFGVLAAVLLLATSACATKKYVRQEVDTKGAEIGERVDGVQSQVEANQQEIQRHGEQIGEISQTAQEALDRALAAGKLAEGKFLYETVLTDENVRFGFDVSTLSDDAKAALDQFAEQVKAENRSVYIEIQGHTDSTGTEAYNEQLGMQRAEAARRYLSMQHGFALHRMSVISYGESAPIADNGTRDGRAQNRRVALVVLQ